MLSATPLPARPPSTAPTAAPTTVPTGPATEAVAAPAAAPPRTAPTPVPTGCAPGSPLIGSRFSFVVFSLSFIGTLLCEFGAVPRGNRSRQVKRGRPPRVSLRALTGARTARRRAVGGGLQLDPDRRVVARLLAAAHLAVDRGRLQPG